jgi:RHS repeat-associated protein
MRMNVVQTKFGRLNAQSSLLQLFAWGLDLSGSLQGAGGVGGLLMVTDQTAINNQPSTHFAAYDGNGNVAVLVAAASGTVSATYEYGPFSEVVRQTGPMAHANKFRFSTKYQDEESDYLYYGYRSYNPSLGRWLNRDSLGEPGFETLRRRRASLRGDGPNLYQFVRNNPVGRIDKLGLAYGNPVSGPNGSVSLGFAFSRDPRKEASGRNPFALV